MSQNNSDIGVPIRTACYQCGIQLTPDNFVRHVRRCPCRSSKRARLNPDVDIDISSTVADGNVLLSEDENEEISLSLEVGEESGGLFGDPYLESLMMESISNLETATAGDSTSPELELDHSNVDEIPDEVEPARPIEPDEPLRQWWSFSDSHSRNFSKWTRLDKGRSYHDQTHKHL